MDENLKAYFEEALEKEDWETVYSIILDCEQTSEELPW